MLFKEGLVCILRLVWTAHSIRSLRFPVRPAGYFKGRPQQQQQHWQQSLMTHAHAEEELTQVKQTIPPINALE